MYGLFTKFGLGAVVSAGLSVLGISYLCTDAPPNHQHPRPAAVVAIQADAALDAGVATAPSSHSPGQVGVSVSGSLGSKAPGATNPGSSTNPGSNPSQPGGTQPGPGCGCTTHNPPLVNVKPDVDVDVDVDVKLPDTDLNAPGIVGGVLGTVGVVVDGVLPDCGCSPLGQPAVLPVPLLGH
jgi:hypothetical protein